MTVAKDVAVKLSVAFVAAALALAFVAQPAKAASEAELQAQIDSLLATIAALQAQMGGSSTTSTSCPALTQPMTIGAQGAMVTSLQTYLIGAGFSISAGATGYFGSQTQAAVAAWQAANGVSPAAGYWGPVSLAKYNAVCKTTGGSTGGTTGGSTGSTKLNGGEASLESFDAQSGDDDEVAEDSDASVMDVEFDVEDGDVMVNRVDVAVTPMSTPTEDDPWDAFDEIAIVVDGDTIAHVDASDEDNWNEDDPSNGDYSIRLTGLDWVVKEGDTAEFSVVVTAAGSVDGAGSDANWNIFIPTDGIRAEDGMGIQNYTGQTSDTVNFDITEQGGDDELNVRTSSDDPDAMTLQLDSQDKSDWITVHTFRLDSDQSENDITVDHLFTHVVLAGGATATNVIDDMRLSIDGDEFDDWSYATGTSASSTFDVDFDLDNGLTIDAGDEVTVDFQVKFKALSSSYEGDTITGSVESYNTDDIEAEGADDLGASQLSGSSTGETHTLRSEGVSLDFVSSSETFRENSDATTADNQGEFTLKFDVTAFEDDIFVAKTAASGTSSTTVAGVTYQIEDENGDSVSVTSNSGVLTSTADTQDGEFVVREGETETFTLKVTIDPTTQGYYQVQLYGVNYAVGTYNATEVQQQALPQTDYESDQLYI
jgi:peptidoglycan hydrolase-like protein with peptidoglycan-binding domain